MLQKQMEIRVTCFRNIINTLDILYKTQQTYCTDRKDDHGQDIAGKKVLVSIGSDK